MVAPAPTETALPFIDDVRQQPSVLRELVDAYRTSQAAVLGRAAALLDGASGRPLLVVGMGSSLTAGRVLPRDGRRVILLEDAGELLHYGLGMLGSVGAVLAISQSGRSYETVAVVDRIRASGIGIPVVALVNDLASPLAVAADVALPLLAGSEANVASKTYVAAVAVLLMLDAGGLEPGLAADMLRTADAMDALAAAPDAAAAAILLGGCASLCMVGRGPGLGTANYAALTTKECSAVPAEPLTGGAFRHGPMEIAGPQTGVVVIAPDGPTAALGAGLAGETAALGSPTWLLAGAGAPVPVGDNLLVTRLPDLPEPLAALAAIVPIQLAAAGIATAAGREPGLTIIATKVTDRE